MLNDLANPSEGVYSATAVMEERLAYTHRMLARHHQMPIVRPLYHSGCHNWCSAAYCLYISWALLFHQSQSAVVCVTQQWPIAICLFVLCMYAAVVLWSKRS